MANTTNNNKVVELSSAKYVRIAEHNGKELQLYARPVNKEDFTNCQVYSLVASRGSVKGDKEYFVTVDDYNTHKPKVTRASLSRDTMLDAMVASGMTREQAQAIFAQAKEQELAKKEAKAQK